MITEIIRINKLRIQCHTAYRLTGFLKLLQRQNFLLLIFMHSVFCIFLSHCFCTSFWFAGLYFTVGTSSSLSDSIPVKQCVHIFIRVKALQIFDLFSDAYELDGNTDFGLYRDRYAALGCSRVMMRSILESSFMRFFLL